MTDSQINILIVDTGYEILSKQLTSKYERINIIKATDNGSNIYEIIKTSKPNIVIMDVFMSGMDGLDILEQIRSDIELNNVKVIIISSIGSPRIISMAIIILRGKGISQATSPVSPFIATSYFLPL